MNANLADAIKKSQEQKLLAAPVEDVEPLPVEEHEAEKPKDRDVRKMSKLKAAIRKWLEL